MSDSKEQTHDTIVSWLKNKKSKAWLPQEVRNLGTQHSGLDDIPIDSIIILATLFTNGALDDEYDLPKFGEYIEALSQYQLISKSQSTERIQLTDKGKSACSDIFNRISARSRFELNRPA